MSLKHLTILTSILFVFSLFVYSSENRKGTDLISGSDYIKGLDISKIQKIVLSFKGKENITLTRDQNYFVIENKKSYPAATNKINELIYKIASIQVKEKVSNSSAEEELKKYQVDDKSYQYMVDIFDSEGKKTVSFRVGKSYKSKGNYLYRLGKDEIYLSQNTVWINNSYKDFLNTLLVKLEQENVAEVELNTDKSISVNEEEKVKKYVKKISRIHFKDYFLPTEPQIQSLKFNKEVKVKLKNKLVYNLSLAKDKENHYLKLNALLEEAPKQFVVNKDDGKEELQKIEDVIKAQSEAQRINVLKSGWVYQIDKSSYENIAQNAKFFSGNGT